VSYDDSTHTATLTPSALLIGGASYAAYVSSSIRAAGGSPLGGADFVFRFITSTCPCSLFPVGARTGDPEHPDTRRACRHRPWTYELGVKFKVDEAMRLIGIRFYKSKSETGVHVANLWTSTGLLLASTTATNANAVNANMTASCSRPMDPSTITASTFNVLPVGTSAGTDAGGAVDATIA
jgi:hypothetical protein